MRSPRGSSCISVFNTAGKAVFTGKAVFIMQERVDWSVMRLPSCGVVVASKQDKRHGKLTTLPGQVDARIVVLLRLCISLTWHIHASGWWWIIIIYGFSKTLMFLNMCVKIYIFFKINILKCIKMFILAKVNILTRY